MVKLFWVLLLLLFCEASYVFGCPAPCPLRIEVGKRKTRTLWTEVLRRNGPVVILIPGSGPQGPEVRIPKALTFDGKDHSLFDQLAVPFQRAGYHTLAIGKPGVEFFSSWDPTTYFYDKALYANSEWTDLIDNVADAVAFVKEQPSVDKGRIFLLGHSEGAHVAVDYAATDSSVAGLILLGYSGENLKTIVDWQLFHRNIDLFVKTDLDRNGDGIITRNEADWWPEFKWDWKPGQESIPVTDIEKWEREAHTPVFEALKKLPLYGKGIFEREPLYKKTAALKMPVHVLNGELDRQTPPFWATPLVAACAAANKKNCHVTLVPKLGHGFSTPRGPRFHPVVNLTIGPVVASFTADLEKLARELLPVVD